MKRISTLIGVLLLLAGCGGGMTSTDESNLGVLKAKDSACIVAHKPNKEQIDACRAAAKAEFEAKEAVLYPDAGFAAGGDAGK